MIKSLNCTCIYLFMLQKTQAIFIGGSSFSENAHVVKLFTKNNGVIGFMAHGTKNNKGPLKSAFLFPLNTMELIYYQTPGKGLRTIKECKSNLDCWSLRDEPIKSLISQFIGEVILKTLPEEAMETDVYDFCENFAHYLASSNENLSVLPLWFMVHYAGIYGVAPHFSDFDVTSRFDPISGRTASSSSNTAISSSSASAEATALLHLISETPLENTHQLTSTSETRKAANEVLLHFYRYHLCSGKEFKSPEILSAVLND